MASKWYALMDDDNELLLVGPFDDQNLAGDWGIEQETAKHTYRGSARVLTPRQWARGPARD